MSSIQTGIELNDQFSGVLNNIISSVNLAVSAMYDMQQSMNTDIDTSSLEGARDEINQATAAIDCTACCGWGKRSGYKRGCKPGTS